MGKDVLELGEYDTPVQKLHEEHGVSEAPHYVDVAGHELDACVPGRAHLSGRLECIVHTTRLLWLLFLQRVQSRRLCTMKRLPVPQQPRLLSDTPVGDLVTRTCDCLRTGSCTMGS